MMRFPPAEFESDRRDLRTKPWGTKHLRNGQWKNSQGASGELASSDCESIKYSLCPFESCSCSNGPRFLSFHASVPLVSFPNVPIKLLFVLQEPAYASLPLEASSFSSTTFWLRYFLLCDTIAVWICQYHDTFHIPCLFPTLVWKLVKDRACVSFSFASLVPSWRVWSRECPGKFDWYVDQLIKWFFHLLSLAVVGEVVLRISSLFFLANLIERIPWLWGLYLLLGLICSRETPKTVTCSHLSFCWGLK